MAGGFPGRSVVAWPAPPNRDWRLGWPDWGARSVQSKPPFPPKRFPPGGWRTFRCLQRSEVAKTPPFAEAPYRTPRRAAYAAMPVACQVSDCAPILQKTRADSSSRRNPQLATRRIYVTSNDARGGGWSQFRWSAGCIIDIAALHDSVHALLFLSNASQRACAGFVISRYPGRNGHDIATPIACSRFRFAQVNSLACQESPRMEFLGGTTEPKPRICSFKACPFELDRIIGHYAQYPVEWRLRRR